VIARNGRTDDGGQSKRRSLGAGGELTGQVERMGKRLAEKADTRVERRKSYREHSMKGDLERW